MTFLRRLFAGLTFNLLVYFSLTAFVCFAVIAYAIARSRGAVEWGTVGVLSVLYAVLVGIVYQGQRIIRRSGRGLIDAREEIARSEEKYRATVENISDLVYRLEVDRDWKISYVNSRIQDLTGAAPAEAVGRPILPLVLPEDRSEFERVLVALREGVSDSVEIHLRMIGSDGGIVHQIHRVSRWVGAEGILSGFIGIGVDITERIRLEERLVRKTTLLELLNEVAGISFAADAPAQPFTAVLSRICGFLTFDAGFVILLREGGETPTILGYHARSAPVRTDAFVAAFRDAASGPAYSRLRSRGGMISEDLDAGADTRELSEAAGLRAVAILPLASIPGATGLFGLGSVEPRPIPQETIGIVATLADQISLAVRNINLFQEVNALSLLDPLTGIANRRHFVIALAQETEIARRYRRPLTVLMADIDRFKEINDAHGHAVGDEVLKGVAQAIRSGTRKADFVCRYGGEEFCVLLPGTDREGGRVLCDRIRKAVAEIAFAGGRGERLSATVSIGVSSLHRDARTMEELLLHADAALYAAKREGRDRVTVYSPPDTVT